MAGDWLKIEAATPDKPEVHAIAAALEMTPDEAFGRLFRVWRWFDQQTEDGRARVTLASLDRHAGVTGFALQMCEVGWLSTGKNGEVSLPNFLRHNGKTAKTRALSAKRSQKYRHASVTPPSRSERDQEKRREDINPLPPFGSSSQKGNTMPGAGRWWLNNETILAEAQRLKISTRGESTESLKAKIREKHEELAHRLPTHAREERPSTQQDAPQQTRGKFQDEEIQGEIPPP